MDKIKKYIRENEKNLSTDRISEEVWQNVEQAITPDKHSLLYTIKTWLKAPLVLFKESFGGQTSNRGSSRIKLALVTLLPALLIFSCTYRVNRTETIGSIISFSIDKDNALALQKVQAVQSMYGFVTSKLTQTSEPGSSSFIGFIKKENKSDNIKKDIQEVPTLTRLDITPVKSKVNESLFSALVHKTFNVHIDAGKPGKKELEKEIEEELKKKGFSQVKVLVEEEGGFQLLVPRNQTPALLDTIVSTNTQPLPPAEKTEKPVIKEEVKTSEEKMAEKAEEIEFVITPATTAAELNDILKEIRKNGFFFDIERTVFTENKLKHIAGYIKYKERKKNTFDTQNFITFKILLNEKKKKGAYRLEIVTVLVKD